MTREQILREIFGTTEPPPTAPNLITLFHLVDVMPEFADEVHRLLLQVGEITLAEQVPHLWIYERCACGDCATMYVQPRPRDGYGPTYRGLTLDSEKGAIYVDIADGNLACLEVLFRPEMTKRLVALLP